uniref:PB1 domain-containing protein n=1 Tax=Kalanchoe fedtschenkoi TaxID=63787 RepID=A0A7N0VGJ4_KALFE
MCNKEIEPGEEVEENPTGISMDSPSASLSPDVGSAAVSTPRSNDESQRVKFLCSFSGSIFPRPQDGKLRYVGGETRIVSVPRDIKYEDLMSRMRELFEGAILLKYQQPDEDLDALVSVVNDDDVTNMMEEYDKLGSSDGFTRLRIFLFSLADQDVPLHFIESDERDSERRYVDALNNVNEPSDFLNQQWDSPRLSFVDDMYSGEQYLSAGPEGSVHNQRNWDVIMPSYSLQHAQYGSGQLQQMPGHRYIDMEPPWNPAPAYYSPRHHGHFDPRPSDFPHSPSSARFRMPVDFPDDYVRPPQVSQQPPLIIHHPQQIPQPAVLDSQSQQPDNTPWAPVDTPSAEKAGFPGNVIHGNNKAEGDSICGQCRMTFTRNPPDLEPTHMGNGLSQAFDPCNECLPNTGNGWMPPNQLNPRAEGPRGLPPMTGRLSDHYIVDGSGLTAPVSNSNLPEGPRVASNYSQLEEPRYVRPGYDVGGEQFASRVGGAGLRMHSPAAHEVPYGNSPFAYGTENSYQVQYGHAPAPGPWRNAPAPMRHGYELPATPAPNGTLSSGYQRNARESSPPMRIGVDNQNVLLHIPPEVRGLDASAMLEYPHGHALRLNTRNLNHHPVNLSPVQSVPDNLVTVVEPVDSLVPASVPVIDQVVIGNLQPVKGTGDGPQVTFEENGSREAKGSLAVEHNCGEEHNGTGDEKQGGIMVAEPVGTRVSEPSQENAKEATVVLETKLSVEELSFLPELIASVKEAALHGAEEVKAKFQDRNGSTVSDDSPDKDPHADGDSDNENVDTTKIEPTKAEAEAIARGLQTIRNEDLEEIRELGSGTYGAVYHGKWKGSDVAVKRIKASCFAGKPSERERLVTLFLLP